MPFDYEKFEAASVTFPTKRIPVPELASFFEEAEKPELEIKGLNGLELAMVNEALTAYNRTKLILDALLSGGENEALKKSLQIFTNRDDGVMPEDHVRRLKMLQFGAGLPEDICVRIAYAKPTIFYRITNEIIKMTGDGADLGK